MVKRAYFFDMDGILFNSMPNHARAWEEVMSKHNLAFTAQDCYLQEGRTGQSVIDECYLKNYGRHATEEEWQAIYLEKTQRFHSLGGAKPVAYVKSVLNYLQKQGALIFIVTGSGQQSLFDMLDAHFPGIFTRDRMITALDVTHGKPDPEPYIKAFQKAQGLALFPNSVTGDIYPITKEDCVVIENAPLGIRAGRLAGLEVYGVNTGPLPDASLAEEGASHIFPDMRALLRFIKN